MGKRWWDTEWVGMGVVGRVDGYGVWGGGVHG